MVVCRLKQNVGSCFVALKFGNAVELRDVLRELAFTPAFVCLHFGNRTKQDLWRRVERSRPLKPAWSGLSDVVLNDAAEGLVRLADHHVPEPDVSLWAGNSSSDADH